MFICLQLSGREDNPGTEATSKFLDCRVRTRFQAGFGYEGSEGPGRRRLLPESLRKACSGGASSRGSGGFRLPETGNGDDGEVAWGFSMRLFGACSEKHGGLMGEVMSATERGYIQKNFQLPELRSRYLRARSILGGPLAASAWSSRPLRACEKCGL